jgi:hypothetical protein
MGGKVKKSTKKFVKNKVKIQLSCCELLTRM